MAHYREYGREPDYRAVREKAAPRHEPYREVREDRYYSKPRDNGGYSGSRDNGGYHGSREKSGYPPEGPYVVPMDRGQLAPDEPHPKWSWGSLILSMVAMFLCPAGSICSILGVLFSGLSYTDHKAKDYERSANKKRWAWGCGIAGLIIGIIIVVAVAASIGALMQFLSGTISSLTSSIGR